MFDTRAKGEEVLNDFLLVLGNTKRLPAPKSELCNA